MSETCRIEVRLPPDRRGIGDLRVYGPNGGLLAGPFPCLGKADNARAMDKGNPTRSRHFPYGDTPTGRYAATRFVIFQHRHPRLGNGWIPLEGIDGEAREAAMNGRTGLGIHGGRGDMLPPTYGCLRMRDRDLADLADALGNSAVTVDIMELR
jgi:hypothetical protein